MIRKLDTRLKELTTEWWRLLLKLTSYRLPQGVHLAIAFGAALLFTFSGARAEATNYYVSPSGNNTDGLSYGTAWTKFDQIRWSDLQGNDILIIDGGSSKIVYTEPLVTPANSQGGSPFSIQPSGDPGHNGQVVIDGSRSTYPNGVELYSPTSLIGKDYRVSSPGSLTVQNWKGAGVQLTGTSSTRWLVGGIESCKNAYGISCQFASNSSSNVIIAQDLIHDNKIANIEATGIDGLTVEDSWIYNSDYTKSARKTYGLVIRGSAEGTANVSSNVFGPGLGIGASIGKVRGGIGNCLFVDALSTSLEFLEDAPRFSVANCTLFQTSQNPYGETNYCLSSNRPKLSISNSIFYGGTVRLPADSGLLGKGNTQWQTSGVTTAIAPTQVNPQFAAPVGTYANNVSIATLGNTNFNLSSGSPATGTGSNITTAQTWFTSLFPWQP
jgi:hypothetical protein